jgi:hypothetical protein
MDATANCRRERPCILRIPANLGRRTSDLGGLNSSLWVRKKSCSLGAKREVKV